MSNLELLQEFQAMDRIPIFEINIAEDLNLDQDEFYIFHLDATEHGIEAGFTSNCGFYRVENLFVEWDVYFNLDSHLEELYEICNEWAIEDYEKNAGL